MPLHVVVGTGVVEVPLAGCCSTMVGTIIGRVDCGYVGV